jgi:hypothetical protein
MSGIARGDGGDDRGSRVGAGVIDHADFVG